MNIPGILNKQDRRFQKPTKIKFTGAFCQTKKEGWAGSYRWSYGIFFSGSPIIKSKGEYFTVLEISYGDTNEYQFLQPFSKSSLRFKYRTGSLSPLSNTTHRDRILKRWAADAPYVDEQARIVAGVPAKYGSYAHYWANSMNVHHGFSLPIDGRE